MLACILSSKITNLGIQFKDMLKNTEHKKDIETIDFFLCQYDYLNPVQKKEQIDGILELFSSEIFEAAHNTDLSQAAKQFCLLLKDQKEALQELQRIPFESFSYAGKLYHVNRDIFNWIIRDQEIIFLIKENDKLVEDNLLALDYYGKVLWTSQTAISCPNRKGALFVGLHDEDDSTFCVNAYVGINYYLDYKAGAVKDKIITK